MLLMAAFGCTDHVVPDPDDTAGGVDTGPRAHALADAAVSVKGAATAAVGNAVAFAPNADGGAAVAIAGYFASEVCVFNGAPAPGTYAMAPPASCWRSAGGGDFAGYALAGGDDLDGDGAGDLLVGAINHGPQGAAFLLAQPGVGGPQELENARTFFVGESGGDYAGSGLAFAGDVDGDGTPDLLVGASSNDAGGSGAGRAYLMRGPIQTGTVLLADADVTISGMGRVGMPPPHGAPVEGDGVGVVLDGAGDIDGDGLADLALGANGSDRGGLDAGAFAIFLGPVRDGALTLDDADQLYIGTADYQYAGDAVARAGDLDGDGLADVLVGGNSQGPGTTWVITGPGITGTSAMTDATTSFVGESPLDYAGATAAAAGDLDGDGQDDVVVGAYGSGRAGPEAGAVYLARGPFSPGAYALADVADIWLGEREGDNAGRAIAGGADADRDGLDDVLVGAPRNAGAGSLGGKAYLLLSN